MLTFARISLSLGLKSQIGVFLNMPSPCNVHRTKLMTDNENSLPLACDNHLTATCLTYQNNLAKKHISGTISIPLFMRQAGQVKLLQLCIRILLGERLELVHGELPPPHSYAHRFRQAFAAAFMTAHAKGRVGAIQLILEYFKTSNWARRRIKLVVPFAVDLARFKAKMLQQVPAALMPSAPDIYPRHRWTGSEKRWTSICWQAFITFYRIAYG